jgi:hypothetical protein
VRDVQPDRRVGAEYLNAFREIVARIAGALAGVPKRLLPVRMYVAGGAALHFYTGERISEDIDAVFSRRVALPENLEVAYRDADGAARLLYFDRQYNDSFALLHEDAHADSVALPLAGLDPSVVEVRLLSPLDLAVSKIARMSDQDREDIASLARRGMITAPALRKRAQESMANYVGDLERLRGSIEIAARIVQEASGPKPGTTRSR